jgi:hypothetical protein
VTGCCEQRLIDDKPAAAGGSRGGTARAETERQRRLLQRGPAGKSTRVSLGPVAPLPPQENPLDLRNQCALKEPMRHLC